MLQAILTGQARSIVLMGVALGLFFYLLPAILSFLKGQKRFWTVLILNLVLTFVQSLVFQKLFPDLFVMRPGNLADTVRISLLANFGPGWLLLLFWVLKPDQTDPRLLRAQQTKAYDAVVALPLIAWFAYGAWQLRAVVVRDAAMMVAGTGTLFIWVQCFSLLAALCFDLLLVYLLVVRDRPIGKARGVLPRLFAFVGTFLGVGILQLPVAPLGLGMQIAAALLIGVGSVGSFLVLWRLGKSFSIMPEARKLVTGGPYAWARHPLYAVEIITILGTALQFQAPWSWLIALAVVGMLWIRTHYEEQVLEENFPEYGEYRARTKRFIPGLI